MKKLLATVAVVGALISPVLAHAVTAPEYKACHAGNVTACKQWRVRACRDGNPAACDYDQAQKQMQVTRESPAFAGDFNGYLYLAK